MKDSNPSFAKVLQMLVEDIVGYADLPLLSFDTLFPKQASLDRCIFVLADVEPPELAGSYGVSDLYCQDPSCDCQKVSLVVFDDQGKIHATIAYGWKSATFYRKWGCDAQVIPSLTQGFLDPWAQQSPNAEFFLKAFGRTARNNSQFISRLKRRYALFKKTIAEDPSLIVPYPEVELHENVVPFSARKVG